MNPTPPSLPRTHSCPTSCSGGTLQIPQIGSDFFLWPGISRIPPEHSALSNKGPFSRVGMMGHLWPGPGHALVIYTAHGHSAQVTSSVGMHWRLCWGGCHWAWQRVGAIWTDVSDCDLHSLLQSYHGEFVHNADSWTPLQI